VFFFLTKEVMLVIKVINKFQIIISENVVLNDFFLKFFKVLVSQREWI